MMRVVVTQLNTQFSEMRNTLRGSLVRVSAEAQQYTDNSCPAIRLDMQEKLDVCYDCISQIYQKVQVRTLLPAACTLPCAPFPPGTPSV